MTNTSHRPLAPTDETVKHPLADLRAIVERVRARAQHEVCDMCAVAIGPAHRHVVDIEDRLLRCLCPHCYLLFDDPGAAKGRYKQIPHRYAAIDGIEIGPGAWDELQIPVSLAFFFDNSTVGRTVAFYPGPAGATESLLPLDTWRALVAANPDLAAAEPDVEALLVRRRGQEADCFIVPIDACYELVGKLRLNWVGFDGGPAAKAEVEGFFDRLKELTGA